MGKVKLLDMLFRFNIGPFKVGGSFHTACPYHYTLDNPYKASMGPSQRHIYSLENWNDALAVLPTGSSGIPASVYYSDQATLYTKNKYLNDYFSKDLVEKNAKFKMVLEPEK
jgi:penicillin G amidase